MKKRARLIAVLALLAGFTVFCGCPGETANGNNNKNIVQKENGKDWPRHHEGLDLETELQIRRDYLNELQSGGQADSLTVNDVWVKKYYGTFNGCVAVMTDYTDADWGTEERFVRPVGGSAIRYEDGNGITVWKDGVFYDLETAVDMKIFDGKSFHRILNEQNGLDRETERQIDLGFSVSIGFDTERHYIVQYYGTYNGCAAVMYTRSGYQSAVWEFTLANSYFWFPNYMTDIWVWKQDDATYYTLHQAYDAGVLTEQDIAEIARINYHAYYDSAGYRP